MGFSANKHIEHVFLPGFANRTEEQRSHTVKETTEWKNTTTQSDYG